MIKAKLFPHNKCRLEAPIVKLHHYPNTSDLWCDFLSLLMGRIRSSTKQSAWRCFSCLHKHWSDSAQSLMTHLSRNISHNIHSFFSWMASENLRRRISHWLRLSGHEEGGWMALFHLHLLLTVCAWGCVRVRVVLRCNWMAAPPRIVELEGSSSYALIMALLWRIPEASSLIDSSVPFLPRPRSAESRYCPTMRCTQASKQPDSQSYTLCAMPGMYRWIQGDGKTYLNLLRKKNTLYIITHIISRRFSQAE